MSSNDLYHRLWPKENLACHISLSPKKGKWLEGEEVGKDEEKRGKGEGPNLSSSHDQQIAQIAGGSLCPHPSNEYRDEWDI